MFTPSIALGDHLGVNSHTKMRLFKWYPETRKMRDSSPEKGSGFFIFQPSFCWRDMSVFRGFQMFCKFSQWKICKEQKFLLVTFWKPSRGGAKGA